MRSKMFVYVWIAAICAVLMPGLILAQGIPPDIVWTRTFGGKGQDIAYSVQQTKDGGYILAGQTNSYPDAWLVKTDAQGHTIWTRTFGGKYTEKARSVQQTTDNGYILAGEKWSWGNGNPDAWLIKTDAQGDTLWTRKFGEISISGSRRHDYARSVQQTNDNGYVLAGYSYSVVGHRQINYDAWLIKTDTEGNKLWKQTFGDSDFDEVRSVQQTNDNGYILAGKTEPYPYEGDRYAWLIKTDAEGEKEWEQTFRGSGWDKAYSVQQTSDGGYVLAGATKSGLYDVWLIKTDSNGEKLWDKTFGGSHHDYAYSVQQTTDNGYILAGETRSYGAGSADAWLIKTDAQGNKEWDQTFGDSDFDTFYSVQQTSNNGYILVGETYSYGAGHSDAWLIKLKGDSTSVSVEEYKQESKIPEFFTLFQNYPNPFNPLTSIQYQLPRSTEVTLEVFNIRGQKIATLVDGKQVAGNYRVTWDGRDVSNGVYFYRLQTKGFIKTLKMILMK